MKFWVKKTPSFSERYAGILIIIVAYMYIKDKNLLICL